jgi:hypothetical protein
MLQHDNFKELLAKEDLPVTRQITRKHAIRLCFVRTLVSVSQSEELKRKVDILIHNHRRGPSPAGISQSLGCTNDVNRLPSANRTASLSVGVAEAGAHEFSSTNSVIWSFEWASAWRTWSERWTSSSTLS